MTKGKYVRNQADDGWLPICGNCDAPYPDSHIGDVKNYPDDGLIAVFFTCEKCGVESSFEYIPYRTID